MANAVSVEDCCIAKLHTLHVYDKIAREGWRHRVYERKCRDGNAFDRGISRCKCLIATSSGGNELVNQAGRQRASTSGSSVSVNLPLALSLYFF